jgi:MFS family permease
MGITFAIFGFFIGRQYLTSLNLLLVQEKKSKGAKAGLFEGFIGFGTIFSPIIAGIIAEFDNILPFFVFAIVSLALFLFSIIKGKN